jgi:S-adenosylmethionine:tRNA ribosyltransferase-isomerase
VLGALEEGRRIVQLYGPDWREKLSTVGRVPLPPYIHRPLDDPGRYQTVYARTGGSAAAPTAGLHFSEPILEKLDQAGVKLARVTLDVGVDTFRPIQVEILEEHQMHGEVCRVPEETVRAVAECEGRVIAVGTTAVRTLESFATGPRQLEVGEKSTRLFIRPGFRFQIIDGMFTNFHMPRTSMLIMLAALASREPVMRAYREAVEEGYRFLSFGDSMLIL